MGPLDDLGPCGEARPQPNTEAAREALEQALSLVESLPPGGRRDFQSKPLKEKIERLSRSAASPGTA